MKKIKNWMSAYFSGIEKSTTLPPDNTDESWLCCLKLPDQLVKYIEENCIGRVGNIDNDDYIQSNDNLEYIVKNKMIIYLIPLQ